jgi:hypothetical protein
MCWVTALMVIRHITLNTLGYWINGYLMPQASVNMLHHISFGVSDMERAARFTTRLVRRIDPDGHPIEAVFNAPV